MFSRVPRTANSSITWSLCHARAFHSSRQVNTLKILMPALSPTMTEGAITRWYKKPGDKVSVGEVLFEIETDKATMDVEATDEGVFAKVVVPSSTGKVPVGKLVALLAEDGEDFAAVSVPVEESASTSSPAAPSPPPPSTSSNTSTTAHTQPPVTKASNSLRHDGRRPLFPSVSLLLAQYGLSSDHVPASGPKRNLLKGDVLKFIQENNSKPVPASKKDHVPSVEKQVPKSPTSASPPKGVSAPVTLSPTTGRARLPPVDLPLSEKAKAQANRVSIADREQAFVYYTIDVETDSLAPGMSPTALASRGILRALYVEKSLGNLSQVALQSRPQASICVYSQNGVPSIVKDGRRLDARTLSTLLESNESTFTEQEESLIVLSVASHPSHIQQAPLLYSSELISVSGPTLPQPTPVLDPSTDRVVFRNKAQITIAWDGSIFNGEEVEALLEAARQGVQNPGL